MSGEIEIIAKKVGDGYLKADASGEIEVKSIDALDIKDEEKGEVEAIIATLDVVDKDFEVITKDAIPDGSKVKMSSYGHDIVGGFMGGGSLPVGKGGVFVEGDKAIFRGKLFMTTERGRDTLTVLKELGKDCEWSFGFRVIGSELPDEKWRKRGAQRILTKLEVFEVSPVLIGAGVGTRTVAAKAMKQAMKEAVKEVDEEAERVKAEEEAAAKKADEEALAKKAEEEAAQAELARLEAERAEAERKAADEAEAKRKEEESAELARKAAEEAEAKRLAEVEAQRQKDAAIRLASTMEFEQFQRTMQRPFVRG